jgi:hypothetical protein
MRSTIRTNQIGLDAKTTLASPSTSYQRKYGDTGSSRLTACGTELSTFVFDDNDEDIEHSHSSKKLDHSYLKHQVVDY